MIRINDLRKLYRTDEVETIALDNMSLHVKEHEFVAIMGPSGCGKSTLLNILGLLDDPTSGSYLLNGVEVTGLNENKRCDLRRENIGFVFQKGLYSADNRFEQSAPLVWQYAVAIVVG